MTFFKQIAIMLSLFLLIILSTVLALNFTTANQAIEERLYEDAKNTATSLSLSLGTANGDISIMSTMIDANFDSGNYLYISLLDVDDEILYERKSESEHIDVPEWFLHFVKLHAPLASANVSAGWSQVGILNVQSDLSYAYKQLYETFISLLASFGVLLFVGLVVLNTLLATALKPLKDIQLQAEALAKNKFIIQENIPKIKEFRDVVVGMNNMVAKVKAMFEKGNEELKKQKELEYTDQITKLKNRKYLIDKLPQYLKEDATSRGGIEMMIAISGVIEANDTIGYKKVDMLFGDIAKIFSQSAKGFDNSIVARMNGTEFGILLPECSNEEGLELAKKIRDDVSKVIEDAGLDKDITFVSIGLYPYNHRESISELLCMCDNALAKAKYNSSHIQLDEAKHTLEVMGKEGWRNVINKALQDDNFYLSLWKVVDTKEQKTDHNTITISMMMDDKTTYSYGQFMASAHQLNLGLKIYQHVIDMIFKKPPAVFADKICSLRLPYEYLVQDGTYKELMQLFEKYAKFISFELVLEIPEKFPKQNAHMMKLYKELFEKYGIKMGIFEFIGESEDYYYLQDLQPLYIKAEASYFLTQNDKSLASLRLITDAIGISLIATGVMDTKTLDELKQKDIYTVQGRVVEL